MYHLQRYPVVLVTWIVFLLSACGRDITIANRVAPVFASTPGTQAVEGSLYSYQPAVNGSAVTFSLTNGPIGATLGGNTISWTPTAGQSRLPNSFTVTATESDGGSATQTWTVTPSGTIRISWIDTLWNESGGSTNKPFDWTPVTSFVAALVPQTDGSFTTLSGSIGANGEFDIPNVPAGYYWLRIAERGTYWTSSSTFDVGGDYFFPGNNVVATTSTTHINFSFTSLDPTPTSGLLEFDTFDVPTPHDRASTIAGSTTFFGAFVVNSNIDFSSMKNGFVMQYEPAAFGSTAGYVLGPELTLSYLSLSSGAFNTISGALNPTVPTSLHLSVQSSAWAPLLDRIAPATPTTTGDGFSLAIQPYIAGPNVASSSQIPLIWTNSGHALGLIPGSCSFNTSLTTDIDGTVQYGDPFPAVWRRIFRVCQNASVVVPVPGTSQTQSISLINDQTTVLPTATVKPLLSGVRNPKINGADLFTATTVYSTAVTLSWDPPAIGTPFGYNVVIMTPTTLPSPNGTVNYLYLSSTTLSTAKTSMTIPPNVLAPGRAYLFVITALADAKANMETSPHRSSLPVAHADVLSAPITTN
ncbi:MAG: hypothetical protein M3O31_10800 [Acidobacteriota bacterium]|nr:hypothetical protein [Acidobacteriota bacterium]